MKSVIRPLIFVTAGLLISLAAGVFWLSQDSNRLLYMLRDSLPPDVEITELKSLDLGLSGLSIEHAKIKTLQASIELRGLRVGWRVQSKWPLSLQPSSVEIADLRVWMMNQPDTSDQPALFPMPDPRESDIWPILKPLAIQIDNFQVHLDNESAVTGRLMTQAFVDEGKINIEFAGKPLALTWASENQTVRIQWLHETGDSGEIEFTETTSAIELRSNAQFKGLIPGLDRIEAQGQFRPFQSALPVLDAHYVVQGHGSMPEVGLLTASCTGSLALAAVAPLSVTVNGCSGSSDTGANIDFDGPLSFSLSEQSAPERIDLSPSSLRLRDAHLNGINIPVLELELGPQQIQDLNDARLTIDGIQAQIELAGVGANIDILEGTAIINSAGDTYQVALKTHSTIAFSSPELTITNLAVDTQITSANDGLRLDLDASHSALGPLAVAKASVTGDDSDFSVSLNTHDWDWSALNQTLTRMPSSIRGISIASAGLVANIEGQLSPVTQGTIQLQLDNTFGTFKQSGVAGLKLEPVTIQFDGEGITSFPILAISADAVQAGLSFNRPHFELEYSDGTWIMRNLQAGLLGGRIRATELQAANADGPLGVVQVEDMDLAQIAALLGDDTIEVQGRVDASIPLQRRKGNVVVDGGSLLGRSGHIRYQAPNTGSDSGADEVSEQLNVTRNALSNLQIEKLDADLSYDAEGQLILGTRIEGRNPDYQSGRPIHLNLTLENNMRTLLESLRTADRINAWVERKLLNSKTDNSPSSVKH